MHDGWGKISTMNDANGMETAYGYDIFNRLSDITKPGDSFPSESYQYNYAKNSGGISISNLNKVITTNKRTVDSSDSVFIKSFDGLGQDKKQEKIVWILSAVPKILLKLIRKMILEK
jgi:hypothetical protein